MAKAKKHKHYMVTYHSPAAALKKIRTASPEEMQAGWKEWMKWSKKCGRQLVEFGSPLMGGVNLKAKGAAVPSKRKVSGYSIVKAPTMAAAKKLMKGHPHLSWAKGCEIEIHEMVSMG